MTIDGIDVSGNNVVRPSPDLDLFWTCESGDNSYFIGKHLSEILLAVYNEFKTLFNLDPIKGNPLLVKLYSDDSYTNNTNYIGDGYRIRIVDHTIDNWDSVIPVAVYELSHEMTHYFIWTVKCRDKAPVPYPYQCWNEEILAEATALYMLRRLDKKLSATYSPGYTLNRYLEFMTGEKREYRPVELSPYEFRDLTLKEFMKLSTDPQTKHYWNKEVRYLYDLLVRYIDGAVSNAINMYNYVSYATPDNCEGFFYVGPVDYERWFKEVNNTFIRDMSRIQPKIVG